MYGAFPVVITSCPSLHVAPLQTWDLSATIKGAFEIGQPLQPRSDTIGLQLKPSEDAAPELGQSYKDTILYVASLPKQNLGAM